LGHIGRRRAKTGKERERLSVVATLPRHTVDPPEPNTGNHEPDGCDERQHRGKFGGHEAEMGTV